MPMTVQELQQVVEVAAGRRPADLYIANGRLVNVYSGEIYPADVAVSGGRVAYVGPARPLAGPGTRVIDAAGDYLAPGFVEPHAHPWSIYNPVTLLAANLARGTTTLVYDDLFFFLQAGPDNLARLAGWLDALPGQVFWAARLLHQSQDPEEELIFSKQNLTTALDLPQVISVAEITRWPRLLGQDARLLELIAAAREKGLRVDGHTAGCSGWRLNAVAGLVDSCHEAIQADEVAERLRLGLWVMLRHSSLRPDLPELLRAITRDGLPTERLMLTCDAAGPSFAAREGFQDGLLRVAVAEGLDPLTALRMVTLNPAAYLGLEREVGSIAPGRRADILLLPDLREFRPRLVLAGGRVVAEEGRLLVDLPQPDWQALGLSRDLPRPSRLADPGLYGVPAGEAREFPVIDLVAAVLTRRRDLWLEARDGFLEPGEGMLHCALLDRRGRWVANGMLQGMGGRLEGLATTYNTASQLLVLGRDRLAMARAARRVAEMGGGLVLVEDGRTGLEMPLEAGGMMSTLPLAEAAAAAARVEEAAARLGYPYHDFFYTLLFLVCDFLPGPRLTARGVIEVKDGRVLFPARSFPETVE